MERLVGDTSDGTAVLQRLLGVSGISRRALRNVLKGIGHDRIALPSVSFDAVSEAFFEPIKHVEEMPLKSGGTFRWEMCHPCHLLATMTHHSERLQDLFAEVAGRRRDAEWALVVSFDEYVPGDFKRPECNRKSMNVAYTFLDFGAHHLNQDALWFVPVTVRSAILADIEGGWSAMLTRFLHVFLWSQNGIQTSGVPLNVKGSTYLLRARLKCVICDGAGLQQALQWRGAGSVRPCFFHGNVLKRDCRLSGFAGDAFVETDCVDVARFHQMTLPQLWSDVDSIVELKRRVAAGEARQALLTNMRYVTALDVSPEGFLNDASVRANIDVFKVFHVDWCHTMLQDGVMTNELSCFVRAAEQKIQLGPRFWESRLKEGWIFPSSGRIKMRMLHRLFGEYRMPTGEPILAVRGNMQDILSLFGLVRHIVETTAEFDVPDLALERESFFRACDIVDLFILASRREAPLRAVAERIREANRRHLAALVEAYGKQAVKPKNHWVFDAADGVERDAELDYLPNTLAMERLHLSVKRIAVSVMNTSVFERSVLAPLSLVHKRRLQDEVVGDGLRGQETDIGGGLTLAARVEVGPIKVAKGDVVFSLDDSVVAVVVGCCRFEGQYFLMVEELRDELAAWSAHSVDVGLSSATDAVWPVLHAKLALAWYEGRTGRLVAVM